MRRINKPYISLMMLFMVLISCQEPNDILPVTLNLDNDIVSIEPDGGVYSIGYTIENAIDGYTLEIGTDDGSTWVHSFEADESLLSFTVEKNIGEDRQVNVSVIYTADPDVKETFVIRQAAPTPDGEAAIVLASDTLSVLSEGGEYSVDYAMYNVNYECQFSFGKDEDWIYALKADSVKIHFSVLPNVQQEPRESEVTISYGDVSTSLVIVQEGAEDISQFKIVVHEENITETSVEYSVFPLDQDLSYLTFPISKQVYDRLGSDQEVILYYIENIKKSAGLHGMSIVDYLRNYCPLLRGNLERFENVTLCPGTDYYIVVFGVDYDLNILSDLFKEEFSSVSVPKSDLTVDITSSVTSSSVKADLVPSTGDYYFRQITKEEYIAMSGMTVDDLREFAYVMLRSNIDYALSFGLSMEDALNGYCSPGPSTLNYPCSPNTEYIIYAIGCDSQGYVNTDVFSSVVTTTMPDPSENEISLSSSSVGKDYIEVNVETTNDDTYVVFVGEEYIYGDMTDEEIVRKYNDNTHIKKHYSGDRTLNFNNLRPSTDYIVMAMGYDSGANTTSVYKMPFTTEFSDAHLNFTFNVSVSGITSTSAMVVVNGYPEEVMYYWNLGNADITQEEILQGIESAYEIYENIGEVSSMKEFLVNFSSKGTQSFEFTNLRGGEDYVVYVAAIDPSTCEFVSEFGFSDVFTTKEWVYSSSSIHIEYDKIWDADEIAENYPEYSSLANQNLYCLPIDVLVSGDAVMTYAIGFKGDLTDESEYSDEYITSLLVQNGSTERTAQYFMPYNYDYTLVAVAVDNDGNYSRVYRSRVNYKISDAESIDLFDPLSAAKRLPLNMSVDNEMSLSLMRFK